MPDDPLAITPHLDPSRVPFDLTFNPSQGALLPESQNGDPHDRDAVGCTPGHCTALHHNTAGGQNLWLLRQPDLLGLHFSEYQRRQRGRILRELTSRTSLILMTYSTAQKDSRDEAAACGCREHRVLLDAIRLRDAREAARHMREHLTRLESQLQFTPPAGDAPDLATLFS